LARLLRKILLIASMFGVPVQGCSEGDEPVNSTGGSSGAGSASGGSGGTAKGGASAGGGAGESGVAGTGGDPVLQGGFGGFGDETGCVREYDLESYSGSTDGLCPAEQVSHCDCDEGAALPIICAPDKSACVYQPGVCEPSVDCGWHDCNRPADDEFCESMQSEIQSVLDGNSATQCVRDADCAGTTLCIQRIYNMMFCAEPDELGEGGQSGVSGQGGVGGGI
jgi:hypothetical protein